LEKERMHVKRRKKDAMNSQSKTPPGLEISRMWAKKIHSRTVVFPNNHVERRRILVSFAFKKKSEFEV
jgi:hypothetical protein